MITRRMMLAGLTAASLVGMLAPAGAHGTHESQDYLAPTAAVLLCLPCPAFDAPATARSIAFTADDAVAGSAIQLYIQYFDSGSPGRILGSDFVCTPSEALSLPEGTATILVRFRWITGCELDQPATMGTLTAHWL